MLKNCLEDYTESEMLEFLNEFFENPKGLKGNELTNHLSQMAKHLIKITAHLKDGILSSIRQGIGKIPLRV